jgi:hypothetical protein
LLYRRRVRPLALSRVVLRLAGASKLLQRGHAYHRLRLATK